MDILRLERHSIRNSAPETQILLVREKQFFLLFKGGGVGRRKRRGKKKEKVCESLICSFIPTVNHINIFGETTTGCHLQGS